MIIEVLFSEVCGLYGDAQNPKYLEATLPDATFIYTTLLDTPYFVSNTPDLIYIGTMSEQIQRSVIEKLRPYKARLDELIDGGTPILATGNAGEIFTQHIDYVTEETSIDGLGIFDLTVKTDLFKRWNGKMLGEMDGITVLGFRSQFSEVFGDNSGNYFFECRKGSGINRESKLEGFRKNNLICTNLLGPVLPVNPLFCEYIIGLTGNTAKAAFRDAAMDAYQKRLEEFEDPKIPFDS